MSEKKDTRKLNEKCPCPYRDCERNRDCEACKEFHHGRGEKTGCEKRQAAK